MVLSAWDNKVSKNDTVPAFMKLTVQYKKSIIITTALATAPLGE